MTANPRQPGRVPGLTDRRAERDALGGLVDAVRSGENRALVESAPGLWRTCLQRYDLSVPGREMIQSRVDVEPGSPSIRHTHPGEIIYVLAGSLEYQIDGQPAKVYNAGEALTVPAGVIHAVRNAGPGTGTALATDIVEKGKPLLTPAQ
jgi:quercetin dioxygenase-like cupin family protein